ncbi:glycosyltransferase family 2 protein [Paraburkholderia sp. RL17-347-BIC-D]|uniref:glycosyltransferase family 2 protein n=1 Tax=Paraburkholderia sp. RL17-347-BIC-D TaxID=3031632 RepID=UPI0038BC933D
MTTNAIEKVAQGLPVSVQVQSILYHNEPVAIERAVTSMARSAELAVRAGACSRVRVRLGDCSPVPIFSAGDIERLGNQIGSALELEYRFFDGNLGSARGHNCLAEQTDLDFVVIQNPDAVASPRLLERMIGCFKAARTGMVEAKQLPIEHPKEYDTTTGETLWASTACAMIPTFLLKQLGGFDADSFFLYCDDVDFSWMVRNAGYRVIFQPAAFVFHDKRLADDGGWPTSAAERYYSAEAAMILAYKWSRKDLAESICAYFKSNGADHERKAALEYERRRDAGLLPAQLDPKHKIGYFVDHLYSKHRYAL